MMQAPVTLRSLVKATDRMHRARRRYVPDVAVAFETAWQDAFAAFCASATESHHRQLRRYARSFASRLAF